MLPTRLAPGLSRHQLIARAVVAGAVLGATPAWAEPVRLGLQGRPDERLVTTASPQKGPMILQRTRPPLLETPFATFDKGAFLIGPPGSRGGSPLASSATPEAAAPPVAKPAPVPTVAAAGATLRSVEVSFPESDRAVPDGPHADVINNCAACHSAGMVMTQPSLKRADWQAEVTKMLNAYKAPASDADAAIVDRLASTKGL